MRNRISSVIALICILVYIAALGFAGWRIYTSISERRSLANREFNALADFASAADPSDFMDESFQGKLRAMLADSKTLEGIIVSGPQDRETVFERVQGNTVVRPDNSPRFAVRFGLDPNHFRSLPNGIRNAAIRGVSSYVEYNVFFDILKYTLFAVIAALSIAFFTLIMELTLDRDTMVPEFRKSPRPSGGALRRKEPPRRAGPPAEPLSESYDDEEPFGDFDDIPEPPAPGAEKPARRKEARPVEQEPAGHTESGETDESFAIPFEDFQAISLPDIDDLVGDDLPPGIDDPAGDDTAAQKTTGTEGETGGPLGLYSPHGNIGWEAYTRERLEAELHRCASFDQDLVLIIMEFKEDLDDLAYKQFTETAVQFFTIRDLIFEKGERGITLIYPNIDLDTGFFKSEEFHNRILSTMSLTTPTDLCIGLSSRSGRLIDANRILMEASQALSRALQDPVSPVVAFKSDLEKYRAFIKNKP
ncbi:MAG: hypothetical protein LBJ24_00620 [Treponema sp.]|nr:hypothetical protein [Treponema sp.]